MSFFDANYFSSEQRPHWRESQKLLEAGVDRGCTLAVVSLVPTVSISLWQEFPSIFPRAVLTAQARAKSGHHFRPSVLCGRHKRYGTLGVGAFFGCFVRSSCIACVTLSALCACQIGLVVAGRSFWYHVRSPLALCIGVSSPKGHLHTDPMISLKPSWYRDPLNLRVPMKDPRTEVLQLLGNWV